MLLSTDENDLRQLDQRATAASGNVLKDARHKNGQRCCENHHRGDNASSRADRIYRDVCLDVSSGADHNTDEHCEHYGSGRHPNNRRAVEQ